MNIEQLLWPKQMGYTFESTLLYSIILIIAIYLIYKLLKRLNVKIDQRLAIAVSPYVALASTIRSLEDARFFSSYWFVTPGIYFFIAFIFFTVFLISIILERKKIMNYHKPSFLIGILILSFMLANLQITNYSGILLVFLFFLPWPIIFYLIKKWKVENRIVSSLHMFDANATFVSMNFFGYKEQHILPTYVINIFGPYSFVILKLVTIVAILMAIDKFSNDREFNKYLKICIGILGAATGLRDFFSLSSLV